MSNFDDLFVSYFCPPADCPAWAWPEHASVVEVNGHTVCYRNDLLRLIEKWQGPLPHFESILAILFACKIAGDSSSEARPVLPGKEYEKALTIIGELPRKYTQGRGRRRLLEVVGSVLQIAVKNAEARILTDALDSGNYDAVLERTKAPNRPAKETVEKDLKGFLEHFPTSELLRRKLETGLKAQPDAIEIEPEDSQEEAALIDQLLSNRRTAGLARLSKRISAALKIPAYNSGISDQTSGGVSDISNRGKLDQLLLSELANEEEMLLARLANNEALYLRKESAPDDEIRTRSILLDTSIRMWGSSRVFGIAVVIGLNMKANENVRCLNFALAGGSPVELQMQSVEGIENAMQILDPDINCTSALGPFLEQSDREHERFLITSAASFSSASMIGLIKSKQEKISYVLTVSAEGELHLYQYGQSGRRLLSESRFDLNEILQVPKEVSEGSTVNPDRIEISAPSFFLRAYNPLLLPAHRLKISPKNVLELGDKSVLAITDTNLLLHWRVRGQGALEVARLPPGFNFAMGYNRSSEAYVAAYQAGKSPHVRFYKYSIGTEICEVSFWSSQKGIVNYITCNGDLFFVKTTHEIEVCPPPGQETSLIAAPKNMPALKGFRNRNRVKKIVNNGYSVLYRIDQLYLCENQQLHLGRWLMDLKRFHLSDLRLNPEAQKSFISAERVGQAEYRTMPENYHLELYRWANGSECVFDHRGLLHFQDNANKLPEFTIVLCMHKPLAAWSETDDFAGNPHFSKNIRASIRVQDFVDKYFRPFIKGIVDHEVAS